MSISPMPAMTSRYKFGWILLLISAGLMTLNHAILILVLDEPVLFTGFAFFNLYAFIVIYLPFRRGEKWAWVATWLLPIGLALPAFNDLSIGALYLGVAGVCALGLLLTMPAFFRKK